MRYRVAKYRPTGEWFYYLTLDGYFLYGVTGFETWDDAYAAAIG